VLSGDAGAWRVGYMREFNVGASYRDIRVTNIYEGTASYRSCRDGATARSRAHDLIGEWAALGLRPCTRAAQVPGGRGDGGGQLGCAYHSENARRLHDYYGVGYVEAIGNVITAGLLLRHARVDERKRAIAQCTSSTAYPESKGGSGGSGGDQTPFCT